MFIFRLFAGIIPRVLWITIGGSLFFGSYDLATRMIRGDQFFDKRDKPK